MKSDYEKSCGAVIFHKFENKYKVLILNFNHKTLDYWGFSKGHVEKDETEAQTAKREIKEETGLEVEVIQEFRSTTEFTYENGARHKVIYFAAKSEKTEINPGKDEKETVINSKWCDFEESKNLLTFDCDKLILEKFKTFLESLT